MAPIPRPDDARSDAAVERLLGAVLRYGVIIAGAVTVVGGALALAWHGGAPENFRTFRGEPVALRSVTGIISGACALDPQSVVQLGIVLLVATPILRVAMSLVAFAARRDRTYVVLTGIVLVLLAVSFFSGRG
jgi:uncharacterized membrane protein